MEPRLLVQTQTGNALKQCVFWFTGSFWTNPQYRLTVEDPGEDDEDGLTQVIVGLMQKDRRKAKSQGEDYLTIGYMMYKVGMNNAD